MSERYGIGSTALGERLRTTPSCRSRPHALGKWLPPYTQLKTPTLKQHWSRRRCAIFTPHAGPNPRDVVASVLYSYHLLHGFDVSAVADWKRKPLRTAGSYL